MPTPLDQFLSDLDECEKLQIIRKDGKRVPLRFNPMQERVIRACIARLKAGKPIRLIVLKARQHGITTLVQALKFVRARRWRGVKALLISHTAESMRKIWSMQRIFLKYSGLIPFTSQFGAAEGPLVWNHDSVLSAVTARGEEIGHGETITFLHASEVSRYGQGEAPDQRARVISMFSELLGAVAQTPESIVILESTANGYGELFEQMWHKAKAGEIDYTPVFIPWHENPEYARPVDGDVEADADEKNLLQSIALTPEQLAWRRHTIANDCNGDPRLFREKYPATDDEAFLVSGSSVFDPDRISDYLRQTKEPVWRGDIEYVAPETAEDAGGWRLTEDPRGPLCIWRQPEENDAYAIGADTAECLDTRSDRDAAVVRSARSRDVVATLAGHWEPGDYALKLAAVALLYNEAFLAVERNNTGVAVVGALCGRLGGPQLYTNLYRYERVDKATGKREAVFGFPTTRQTKRAAVEAQMALLRSGEEGCWSEDLLLEAKTFVNLSNGRMGAQQGCRDDLVTGWCISALVIDRVSLPARPEDKRVTVDDMLGQSETMAAEDFVKA